MENALRKRRLINFVLFFLIIGGVMAIEEPAYKVLEKKNGYEIRQYREVIVAETMITQASFEDAGNLAFDLLGGYIFGNNTSSKSIAMTAPVNQSGSEKIAMTAPVNQSGESGTYHVCFTMPSSYSLETLPRPNDKRVILRKIPGRKLAVLRYAGNWSQDLFNKKKDLLLQLLARDGLKAVGPAEFARFNPPFLPSFFRRNEVWIPIQ